MAPNSICCIDDCYKPVRARGYCNSHYLRLRLKGHPLAGGMARGTPMRWLEAHTSHQDDDCLIWPFSRNNRGYPRINVKGFSSQLAHRVMCELVHGPAHRSRQAAHSCGNGHLGCVNPRHLRWATQVENSADRIAAGTSNLGARNGRSKYDESTVKQILAMRKSGHLYKEIAAHFGIPFSTIAAIASGQNWKHLQ